MKNQCCCGQSLCLATSVFPKVTGSQDLVCTLYTIRICAKHSCDVKNLQAVFCFSPFHWKREGGYFVNAVILKHSRYYSYS